MEYNIYILLECLEAYIKMNENERNIEGNWIWDTSIVLPTKLSNKGINEVFLKYHIYSIDKIEIDRGLLILYLF